MFGAQSSIYPVSATGAKIGVRSGAVNNGASEIEIRETLLQTAAYSGLPTGMLSFRVGDAVIRQLKEEGKLP